MPENCVFCRIGKGELPSFKIHEDKNYISFMDISPPTFNGKITMPTVVIATKKHIGSNLFEDLNEQEYTNLLKYTRKIARAIQKGLNPTRVCLVFEGMEINHIHPKLYAVFSESYPNYLSTEKGLNNKGTLAPKEVLQNLADKIKSAMGNQNL